MHTVITPTNAPQSGIQPRRPHEIAVQIGSPEWNWLEGRACGIRVDFISPGLYGLSDSAFAEFKAAFAQAEAA